MATLAPLPGFVDLQTAALQSDKFVNVIGVVVRFELPMPSKGTDYTVTFALWDPSLKHNANKGLDFRFFNKSEERLPKILNLGDIVVVRNVRMRKYNGRPTALSQYHTQCIVFPHGSIPIKQFRFQYTGKKDLPHQLIPGTIAPTVEEQQYAIALHDSVEAEILPTPKPTKPALSATKVPKKPSATTNQHGNGSVIGDAGSAILQDPKFRLIKELEANAFANLIGEVVKMHPNDYGHLEMYLTDYTSNSLMFNQLAPEDETELYGQGSEGDQFGYASTRKKSQWPGPYGTMTFQVELHEPHAHWARTNLAEGEVAVLQNVRAKMNKINKLSGNLWMDQKYPEKILVGKCDPQDSRVKGVLQRKKDYWNARNAAEKDVHDAEVVPGPTKSKKKKKKQKKKNKASANGDQEQSEAEIESALVELKVQNNQHVKCAHQYIPVTSISYLLDNPNRLVRFPSGPAIKLPFVNLKCRASVRIVDFFPNELEDFSRSLDDPAYNNVPADSSDNARTTGWEWCFVLFVEDSTQPAHNPSNEKPKVLKLVVGGEHAEFLLKLDATDLRQDSQTLAKLREKMFILWGELEEQFAAGLDQDEVCKGPAFECCVQEYGLQRADGSYEPVRRMWGTTIQ